MNRDDLTLVAENLRLILTEFERFHDVKISAYNVCCNCEGAIQVGCTESGYIDVMDFD